MSRWSSCFLSASHTDPSLMAQDSIRSIWSILLPILYSILLPLVMDILQQVLGVVSHNMNDLFQVYLHIRKASLIKIHMIWRQLKKPEACPMCSCSVVWCDVFCVLSFRMALFCCCLLLSQIWIQLRKLRNEKSTSVILLRFKEGLLIYLRHFGKTWMEFYYG